MLRRVPPSVLVTALLCAGACDKPTDKTPAPSKQAANDAAPVGKPKVEPAGAAEAPAETPAETPAGDRPPAPAWFDASKFEHVAIVSQIASKEATAGGFASALILELAAATTNEQCIATAKQTLGESITTLPEPIASGDRMMLQGKTDGYDYMIVCGQAKGKPTLYLSYTAK